MKNSVIAPTTTEKVTNAMILAEMAKRNLYVGTEWETSVTERIKEGVSRVLSHGRDYFIRHACHGKEMVAAIDALAFPSH